MDCSEISDLIGTANTGDDGVVKNDTNSDNPSKEKEVIAPKRRVLLNSSYHGIAGRCDIDE